MTHRGRMEWPGADWTLPENGAGDSLVPPSGPPRAELAGLVLAEWLADCNNTGMEPLYLYLPEEQPNLGVTVREFLARAQVPFTSVTVKPGSPEEAEVLLWSGGLAEIYPLVRIGTKIRANLFNPSTALLARLFPAGGQGEGEIPPLDQLTVFTTTWCPDCLVMDRYLKYHRIPAEWINADKVPGTLENIIRWSGGRQTVPSMQWGTKVRMFHPGVTLAGKLLKGS